MKKYIYYIENSINEHNSTTTGYFDNMQDAMDALADCTDWYRSKGTGRIYRVELGLRKKAELVYSA